MKPSVIPLRWPTLSQRAIELQALKIPDAQIRMLSGKELRFNFRISPGEFGRLYRCQLKITPDSLAPEVFVLSPCLKSLAGNGALPHIYPYNGPGTKLCLWWPKRREWVPQMKLVETFIPWTAEWLWYFEDWLYTGEWDGGGAHPIPKASRSNQSAQWLVEH